MKTTALILMVTLFAGAQMNAQKKQIADPSATTITWFGNKIIGSAHTGTIGLMEGWLTTEGNVITGGEFTVDMNSIVNTDVKDEKMRERLVGHLKSDDFFGVEKYPLAKLTLTGSSEFSDGKATVRGNLTIKEATHPVEFTALWSKSGDVSTYTATIVFDRSKYDVRFGSGKFFSNLGDNAINDEIKLEVQLVVK
ncbi:MAG: YceI family protein [Bacteroidales bacterium]|jgi:polyisoprenoid-binding protein YceI|nr:YceI family protein [Bacteroidales bacterium]